MKKILILTMLLCLMGFVTACENKIIDANDYLKKDDDSLKSNSLVGTWHSVDYKDGESVIIGKGIKVIFTETTVTTFWSDYDDAVGFYDNIPYTVISENEIQLTGNLDPAWSFEGKHITKFAFHNDTLVINHFIPTFATVPYPANVVAIGLVRV